MRQYARSGVLAEDTVQINQGPLPQFQHDQEPMLRSLGMPTTLNMGVVELLTDYVICRAGDILTPEQCRLLKLFNHKLVDFQMRAKCVWTKKTEKLEILKK